MAASVTSNGELTAEQVQKVLLDPLALRSAILSAAPVVFDSPSPVRIPKLTGFDADPGYVGENAPIPTLDGITSEVTMLPDSLKSIKILHRFSNELARQSVVDYATAMGQAIVKRVGNALDSEFLNGDGTAGVDGREQILGLANQPGITELAVAGAITLDDLQDAVGAALADEANPNRWIMRPETFTALRKSKDSSARYQLAPDPSTQAGFTLLGIPVTVTKSVGTAPGTSPAPDTTSAFLVDFSQVAVVRDVATAIKLLDQTYADFDQMALRIVSRWDLGVLNAPGVVHLSGITV